VSPEAWSRAQNNLRTRALIETLYRYSDGQRAPWIHLMDGGISDNLALRVLLNDMLLLDTRGDRFATDLTRVRRILVISVDGQSAPNPNWPRQRIVSGLGQVLSAVSSTQIGAYNIETLIALQSTVGDLVDKLRSLRCRQAPVIGGFACGDVEGTILRVSLSDYPDPEERARLVAIRTGLTLPREQVDELVVAGETMIRRDTGAIAGFLKPGSPAALMARRR
jgi:NTE family protein